jgi:hypothetical protein
LSVIDRLDGFDAIDDARPSSMAFFHGVDPVVMMRGERVAASHFSGGRIG